MPKCILCGKDIPKGEAYVAHTMSSTGRLYKKNYCSEAEYINHQSEMEYRDKVMKLMVDYMGYVKGGMLPNIANKQLAELNKTYPYKVIYNVLRMMESNLRQGMRKEFSNDYGKTKYFLAILSNNINEEYAKLKREIRIEKAKEQESTHIEVDFMDEIEKTQRTASKVSDISDFLD